MRYADRDGNIYEEENGQDRLLHWMYTTMAGRASLKTVSYTHLTLPTIA